MSISKDTPTVSKSAGDLHVTNGEQTFRQAIQHQQRGAAPDGSTRQFW